MVSSLGHVFVWNGRGGFSNLSMTSTDDVLASFDRFVAWVREGNDAGNDVDVSAEGRATVEEALRQGRALLDLEGLIAAHEAAMHRYHNADDAEWEESGAEVRAAVNATRDSLLAHRPVNLPEAVRKAAYMASCRAFTEWEDVDRQALIDALTPVGGAMQPAIATTRHDALIEAAGIARSAGQSPVGAGDGATYTTGTAEDAAVAIEAAAARGEPTT